MPPREAPPAGGGALPRVRGRRGVDVGLMAYARAFAHPCKVRVLKWLVRGLASRGIEVRQSGGAVLTIDPADYVGWQIFTTGQYEPASLALARRLMAGEPGLFVDAGAHFGWYSLAIAPTGGTRVIAVEPDSKNCAALRANIARNGLHNIIVCNIAVGPEPALLPMSRRARGNSGTAAVGVGTRVGEDAPYWVAATSLQGLLEQLVWPPVRPILLKLDVEGFERQVLAGLDFSGAFRPKNILVECESAFLAQGWGSYADFAAFFAQKGYALHDVFGRPFAGNSPLPEANVWARDCGAAVLRS